MSNIIAVPLNKLTRSAIFDPTLLPLDLHLRGEKNAGLAETLPVYLVKPVLEPAGLNKKGTDAKRYILSKSPSD
jgi:hypothetical protein